MRTHGAHEQSEFGVAAKTAALMCSICQEELKNQRLLPCIHSFCLECLEQYCREKLPGDNVPCPNCRMEFQVPENGVDQLPVRPRTRDRKLKVDSDASASEVRGGESPYCEKHHKRKRMHCFDCQENVCSTCCVAKHGNHKFEWIEKSIDDEISQIASRIESFRYAMAHVEEESNKLLDSIKSIQEEVKARSVQVKQMIDRQEKQLLQHLEILKRKAVKAAKSRTELMKLRVAEMESLKTSSSIHLWSSSLTEIMQGADDMRVRAKELLQAFAIPDKYSSPRYKFTPVDVEGLLGGSLIGQVVEDGNSVKHGHTARLCHLCKWSNSQSYGLCVLSRVEHCISDVAADSPAEEVRLRVGDRIVEVNGENVEHLTHSRLVKKIEAAKILDEVRLLAVDPDADKYFRQQKIAITGTMEFIQHICPVSKPVSSISS